MTDNPIQTALRDSVNEVLEKMFFAQTMGDSLGDAPEDSVDGIAVGIEFHGKPSGSLLLRLTAGAASQIAADFLGMDEAEVPVDRTAEVIRELTNMICGSVLSRVESDTPFRLDTPRIAPLFEELAGGLSQTRYSVQLSNGRLTVTFGAGSPLCPLPVPSAY